jgi:hypothetical protein
MTAKAEEGTWVELHSVVLLPGKRAPQVPDDTQQVPLELKVKGILLHSASIGQEAEILTASGRRVVGTILAINPEYDHGFGSAVAELITVGAELREMLRDTKR